MKTSELTALAIGWKEWFEANKKYIHGADVDAWCETAFEAGVAHGAAQREAELMVVKVGEFDHPEHCWKWTKLEVDFVNKQLAAARLQGAREEPVNAGLAKLAHTQALRIKELEQASAVNQGLLNALKEIEWSNDSKWQADRARAAIAAAAAAEKENGK